MPRYDVVIVGGGIVGMTAALALAQQTSFKIAVVEAKEEAAVWQKDHYGSRVSAVSLASKRIFQALGVWDAILAKRVSPYTKMSVWDASGKGGIQFDCRDVRESTLGYIIEDQVMRDSLQQQLIASSSIDFLCPLKLTSLEKTEDSIELQSEKEILTANLVIAADGAHSWVREKAAFSINEKSYNHVALVTRVQTELPNQATAWQRFLTTGPLAFLPLSHANECSIVWSTSPAEAQHLLSLSPEDFCAALGAAFDYRLGRVQHCYERFSFPLNYRHASQYVQEGIALIGDAAHTIHPLAGQGVNLGLLDAATLAEVIADAARKQRDYASFAILRRYERWRKSENALMLQGVGWVKQLFASEKQTLQRLRNTGLNLVNQITPLKNLFASYALGNHSNLPQIARPIC